MYDVKVLHLLDKVIELWKSFSNELKIFIVLMIFWILLQELYYWMEFV